MDINVTINDPAPISVALQGAVVDGGSGELALTAAEAIGGHRVVSTDAAGEAVYTDPATAASVARAVGLSVGAAAAGASLRVRTAGALTESSWAWTPGPVYAGASGVPTQTVPATGHILQIGVAVSATKLVVRLEKPIYR